MQEDTPFTRRTIRVIIGTSLVLVFLHVALHLVFRFRQYVPEELLDLFAVTDDQGLHSWLTVTVMTLLGFSCFVLVKSGRKMAWVLTGLLFIGLSIDDFCRLHERIGEIAWPLFEESTSIYAWLFVMGPILVVCGVIVFVQMWKEFPDRRDRVVVLAGFACLATSLVLEVLEGVLLASGITWRGINISRYGQPIEEFLELLGPTLLLSRTLGRLESGASSSSRETP